MSGMPKLFGKGELWQSERMIAKVEYEFESEVEDVQKKYLLVTIRIVEDEEGFNFDAKNLSITTEDGYRCDLSAFDTMLQDSHGAPIAWRYYCGAPRTKA